MNDDELDDAARVRAYLETRDTKDLIDRVLNLARISDEAWLGLVSEARISTGDLDIAQLKKQLTAAIRVSGYMHWRQVRFYAEQIEAIIEMLRALYGAGHAAPVVELAEHVIARLDTAMGHIDDSSGALGLVCEDVAALHLAACEAARPDPRKLAVRMLELTLRTDLEWFFDAPLAYAEVFGEAGLAAYRKRLDKEWVKFAPLEPGDRRWATDHDGPSRFMVSHLKENLARAVGDIDELVDVLAHDLSVGYRFVLIAEELDAAGREREALRWLERGFATFPPAGDDRRLRLALIDAYRRDGFDEEAVDVARAAFDQVADAGSYEELRRAAQGTPAWDPLRAFALRHLRGAEAGGGRLREAGRSSVVRVMIDEGDVEQAWRDACEGGCTETLWYELAELRSETHPDDALEVFRRRLGKVLERADIGNYRDAVQILKQMEATLVHADREQEFAGYVAAVRADNRRRPKLVEMLDKVWPPQG